MRFDITTLSIGVPREPPKEFRVFKPGTNATTKGPIVFDERAAAALMARYAEMGRRVTFDYDHGALLENPVDPSKSGKSAGSADLELRDGELWVTNIRWTEAAESGIRAEEWLYFSPAVTKDKQGRPLWLVNIALTNNPATYDINELMAANAVEWRGYPVKDGGWDADAATLRLRKWATPDGSGDTAKINWERYRRGFAYFDQETPEALGSYKLPHHDVVDGELVTSRSGTQAAAAALSGARGGVDVPESDREQVMAHIARHYEQWGGTAPWKKREQETAAMGSMADRLKKLQKDKEMSDEDMCTALGMGREEYSKLMAGDYGSGDMHGEAMGKLAKMLEMTMEELKKMMGQGMQTNVVAASVRLAADSAEDVILRRLTALAGGEAELLSATGKPTLPEALGVITAWKDKAEKFDEAAKEIAALKATAEKGEFTALLSVAEKDGKLTPARQDKAEALYKNHGRASAVAYVESLDAIPAIAGDSLTQLGAGNGQAQGGNDAEKLSPEELETIEQLGVSKADYIKHRATLRAS